MSGLEVKYAELFSLSVEQPFYQNNICYRYTVEPDLDFTIVPSPECAEVMQRLDLIFRPMDRNGGFTIFGRTLGKNGLGNDLIRFPAKGDDKLTFLVGLQNPEVLANNDLPVQLTKDVMYYFSNNITDAASPRDDLHLTQDEAGVKWPDDSIKMVSDTYRYKYAAEVVAGTVKVKHLLSGAFVTPKFVINDAGKSDLLFDLFSVPSGKCQLLINNVVIEEFYYLGKTNGQPVFAVIELILSSTTASNYRMIEPDGSLTPQRPYYKIVFINRKTIWRYSFQLQTNSPLYLEIAALTPVQKADFLNTINIVSNDTSIVFHQSLATDTAFEFVSSTALALHEKPVSSSVSNNPLSLKLKKYIGDVAKEAAVKNDLPYPSSGTLNATGFPTIYSDIFLTL